MSLGHLFQLIPWAIIAPWLASQGIPYLSALVSTGRNTWRGVVVAVLAFATSVLSVLVASGNYSAAHWKEAVANGFITWALARLHDKGITEGSPAEKVLHRLGSSHPAAG